MVWQLYENQKFVGLDQPMAEQLSQYLEKKESQLSAKIVEVILQFEGLPSLEESLSSSNLRLGEAIEEFGRKIHRAAQAQKKSYIAGKWKNAAELINHALWNYVEILEGCVVELFQQIDQIGFELWNVDVMRATTSIKDELTHRMEDLIWAIRRIEQQLKLYRRICEANEGKWGRWRGIFLVYFPLLDSSLELTVRKCNKYLNFSYGKFVVRYTGYLQLYENVQKSMNKFYPYRVLSAMDIHLQDKLKQLYFLLTLWEDNCKAQTLPRTEPVRALRNCLTFESAASLFKDYFFSIREAIFDKSRLIKKEFRLVFIDKQSKQPLIENLASYLMELEGLKGLIIHYKKFHLQTDPGTKKFFKKIFGRSHDRQLLKHFDQLHKLIHEIENLAAITANFKSALNIEPGLARGFTAELRNEIDRHLHELGQPLASKSLMHRNGKAIVQLLQSLDEISSFDPEVSEYICRVLSKAMSVDWKYHVLQEIPAFHQIYEVHQGIFNLSDEKSHLNRLHKFQRILNQLEFWLKNEEVLRHAQEINLDINDLKAYLQDFLAQVQRLEPEQEINCQNRFERPAIKAAQALLQYLYLFGRFFSHFCRTDSEHRLLRNQLLFIDQYLEAIERKIEELSRN